MSRIASILAALSVVLWSASCDAPPPSGEIATVSSAEAAVQFTCTKSIFDPVARWPWTASYPLAGQHVYCQHFASEVSPSVLPAGVASCDGANWRVPGLYEVNIWVRDNHSSPVYRCTRISLPALPAHFHLSWVEMMEWGYLSQMGSSDPGRYRWIQGFEVGPGTAITASSFASGQWWKDASPTGCPVPPTTNCVAASVPSNGNAGWVQVDLTQFPETIDLHRF